MRALVGAICVVSILGSAACGDDDDIDSTAVLCKAGELVIGVVAGHFDIHLPQALDSVCAKAVAVYRAQNSPLLVKLNDGTTLTIPPITPSPATQTTLSPALRQLLDDLARNGATVNS